VPTISLGLAVLIAYAAFFVVLGAIMARRVKRADDFLVAGRRLGPGLIASTFLAANIGSGSTVGATGIGYRSGWTAWWWVGCAGIGSLILAQVVGPRIWRLATERGWRTVGDFLEWRYSRTVRGLIAALLWVGTLMILAGQLIAISVILRSVADMPKWEGCLIGAVIVSIYFVAGGLFSTAWVNVIQMSVKLAGFAIAVPVAIAVVGGWSAVQQAAHATTPLSQGDIFDYLFVLVPSFIVSPGLVQKLYGAKDESSVRTGITINGVVLLIYALAPAIIGIIARAKFPHLANSEDALTTVMTQLLPPWLGLVTVAAIFSAELSASDAALFMLSSSLSIDLYKTFIRPKASDGDVLTAGRLAAIVAAFVAVMLAIELESVVTALKVFYSLMAAALAAPFIFGLYSRRGTARRAILVIVVAVAVTALKPSAPYGIIAGSILMVLP
jgi:SSS family solute:Na+ symporter